MKVMRKNTWMAVITLFVSAMCLSGADAAHDDIPRIQIGELKILTDGGMADLVILDAQPGSIYDRGHIKGALSLPWVPQLKETDVQHLSKNKLTVTYCDCGPGENDSADLAAQLIDMGFQDVRVLADPAIRGWKKAGFPIETR